MNEKNKNVDSDSNLKKGRKWAAIIAVILAILIILILSLALTYPWKTNSSSSSSGSSSSNNEQILKKKDSLGFISEPTSNTQGWNSTATNTFYFPMILTNQTSMWQSSSEKPIYKSLDVSNQYYLFNNTGTNLTSSNFKFIYEGLNPSTNYYDYASSAPTVSEESEMLTWLQQNVVINVEPANSQNVQVIDLYIPTTSILPNIDATAATFNDSVNATDIFYNLFFNSGFALTLSNQNVTSNVFESTSMLFSFSYCDPTNIVYFGNSTPSNVATSSTTKWTTSDTYFFSTSSATNVYQYNALSYNIQNVIFSSPTSNTVVKLIPSMTPSQYYVNGNINTNYSSLDSGYSIKSVSYVTENNLTGSTTSGNDISFNATNVNWKNNTTFSGVTSTEASPYVSADITIVNNSTNQTVTFSEIIAITNNTNYV